MVATFQIQVGKPLRSPALPVNGVVREGDGTMTAWVTTDHLHYSQRIVKIGMVRDGYWQVVDGLKTGELVVTDGAILLDNMAFGGPAD
jgi:cobalt-zinc-cadmium efflux system membrane fusion protein